MCARRIEMIGKKFNKLTVISVCELKSSDDKLKYNCLCDCGNSKAIIGMSLRSGSTKSCGCLLVETVKKRINDNRDKYFSNTPEYRAWIAMKNRCYSKGNKFYYRYGERGIKVCDEWINNYKQFLLDIGNRPSKKHSLDRIDNNGNYEPNNCKWSTTHEQGVNRKNVLLYEMDGLILCKKEWAKKLNISIFRFNSILKRIGNFTETYNYILNEQKDRKN